MTHGTEEAIDAAATDIADKALSRVDRYLSWEERRALRQAIEVAIEALIDECRVYYRKLGAPIDKTSEEYQRYSQNFPLDDPRD